MELDTQLLKTAKRRALYLLGMRAYSRGELGKKLADNYPADICDEVIEWVDDCGYLNDLEYCEKLAERLIRVKRYGLRKARWEMKQKLIPEEIIEEVLLNYDSEDIRDEITELIKKKYIDRLDDRKDAERVIGALARRGYDYDDIKHCISELRDNIEMEYD